MAQLDESMFDNAPAPLDESMFDNAQNAVPPITQNHWWNNPYTALLAGGLKGIGELGYGIGTLPTRAANLFRSQQNQQPLPMNPFDYSQGNDAFAQTLGSLEKKNPVSSKIGEVGSQIAGLAVAPQAALEEGVGLLSPSAASAMTSSFLPRLATGVGNTVLNSALYNPIANPTQNLPESLKQGAISGLEWAPVSHGLNLGFGLAGRIKNALNANPEEMRGISNQKYTDALDTGDETKFQVQPNNYRTTLQNELDYLDKLSGSTRAEKSDLEQMLTKRLNDINNDLSDDPNGWTLRDAHEKQKNISKLIGQTQPGTDDYRVLSTLRSNIMDDIGQAPSLYRDNPAYQQQVQNAVNKYQDATDFYRDNVMPVKENPFQRGHVASEIGLSGLGAAALGPVPAAIGSAVIHGTNRPMLTNTLNLLKLIGSKYQGGLGGLVNSNFASSGPVAQALLPLLSQLQNQGGGQ